MVFCQEQLVALAVSEMHITQMQGVIGPRVSWWLEEGGVGKDPFHKYSDDSFDKYSKEQSSNDGTEDGSPHLLTRAGSLAFSQ